MVQITLPVRGMTCSGREPGIRRALEGLAGVAEARVSSSTGVAVVRYDPGAVTTDQIVQAIRSAGAYDVGDPRAA